MNNSKWPTLTVILNTHTSPDTPRFVTRALESVVTQEFSEPWEVIVVNDGEANEEIFKAVDAFTSRFEAQGVNFVFFGTEEHSGYQCYPKNQAIQRARGEYIAFLDMDNEYLPGHLQQLYDALVEGDVWPDFTYARRTYVRDPECAEKVPIGGNMVELREGESPFMEWNATNFHLMGQSALLNFVDTSDFMTSRGAFWRLQMATGHMWNEGYRRFADYELILRAAGYAGWRGKAIDKVLTVYHFTGKNVQLTRPAQEGVKGRPMTV